MRKTHAKHLIKCQLWAYTIIAQDNYLNASSLRIGPYSYNAAHPDR